MKTFLYTFLFISLGSLSAQGFSGGFKAGLNFSTFNGETEMDADGNELETFNNTTGFHVAATFAYAFTDLFGVKADLMYSQKGVSKKFEGPSYVYIYTDLEDVRSVADLRSEQSIVNSYIDIPLMAYYRIGAVEIAGGPSVGFLVNSRGTGSGRYSNTVFGDEIDIVLNYETAYFSDGAARESILILDDTPIVPDGPRLPEVVGAYYNNDSDEPLFNRFDFGLVGEVNFFLNNGLFVGGRYSFGLTDVTDSENDLELQRLAGSNANEERVFRDDKDYNRSFQVSIGFRF
ncbi:hypothetical protein CEQ90_19670 [Lewinellaceae bacterium SD302]|nr:hypothetical protein CEQ90_19670 [Lewinellaceae bacterium SD302]